MLSALATNARLGLLRPSAFGAAPPQCVSSRPRPCENKKLFPEILILAICVRPIRSESNHARVFPSFLCSRFNEREFSHGLDPKRSVVNVGCAAGRTTAPYRIPSRGRWMEVAADAGAICGINQCRGC